MRSIVAVALAFAMPAQMTHLRAAPPSEKSAEPAVERWRPFIVEASRRFGIPQAWIVAVMQAESAGRTGFNGRPTTSRAGAMGLMQLMPATWTAMRHQLGLGSDPHDPRDNILAGTAYLRAMYDRFGYPGLFAAYNAGPARYADHLATTRPLPGETRAYLATVATATATPRRPTNAVANDGLFVMAQVPLADAPPKPAQSGALFFTLTGAGQPLADDESR